MSRWIEFVKKWAKDNDTTYGCALSQPECSKEYRAKYGNRKKLPVKKEREMMGAEDKDAGDILPKKKPKKPDNKPLMEELKKKVENKKELLEMSRMMGEDYNVLKGKVGNEVSKIEKKTKESLEDRLKKKLTDLEKRINSAVKNPPEASKIKTLRDNLLSLLNKYTSNKERLDKKFRDDYRKKFNKVSMIFTEAFEEDD